MAKCSNHQGGARLQSCRGSPDRPNAERWRPAKAWTPAHAPAH